MIERRSSALKGGAVAAPTRCRPTRLRPAWPTWRLCAGPTWRAGPPLADGEKRTLIVPYWLAYGEKGVKGHIPPKSTLIFDIELAEVAPAEGP